MKNQIFRKQLAAMLMSLVLAIAWPAPSIAASDTIEFDAQPSIGDLLERLEIQTNDSTTVTLTTLSIGLASSKSGVHLSANQNEIDVLQVKSSDSDGNTTEIIIAAADDEDGKIVAKDMSIRVSVPSGFVNGSVLDYESSLDSTHDYYFALGTTYSSTQFSYKYAFRPSSMYCYVRAEPTATHTVSSMKNSHGLSGFWVNSSGVNLDPNAPFYNFNKPNPITNPSSGTQYYMPLSALWIADGYGPNDYLWVPHMPFSYILTLEIQFDDNLFAYIEHTVYAP